MYKTDLKIQGKINITNATQRTITVIGGKGTGKTTLIKMFIDLPEGFLVFDPLNVINFESENLFRIGIKKDDSEKRIKDIAKIVNKFLGEKKKIILFFSEMVKDEIKDKMEILFPALNIKDCFVVFDEIHEFVPHFGGSVEIERFIRHCRNKNIGIIMSTQRPASVATNVIALTDYLILFRITWKNDTKAVQEILQYKLDKDQQKNVIGKLQTYDFMEGYVVDFIENRKV
jgi:dephospho-CoA kinase